MVLALALLVGLLFGVGTFLTLRRTLVQQLLGLGVLGNGANLLIFTVVGLVRARPPITSAGQSAPATPYADPVAQALILTAIVISLAVTAFSLALAHRAHETLGTDVVTSVPEEPERGRDAE